MRKILPQGGGGGGGTYRTALKSPLLKASTITSKHFCNTYLYAYLY
jgi:hypothetical protein